MQQWERNLRNLTRFGHYVVQAYTSDLITALAEIETLRAKVEQAQAAAMSAIDQTPWMTIGAEKR